MLTKLDMCHRPAQERGITRFEWLDSRHSFSFGHYYDPEFMGFGALRVINEDRVEPGTGFDTHGHQDMEIISYVIEGALEHRDSLGNGSTILPGEVQIMTAGTGIRHSEFNPSSNMPVHFLQIWIVPEQNGLDPGYQQKSFPVKARHSELCLVASRDEQEGSLKISQNVNLYLSSPSVGQDIEFAVRDNRRVWIQVARGALTVNNLQLEAGDGIGIMRAQTLAVSATESSEFLLFDLAG